MDVLMVFKLAPFECSPSEDENPQLVRDCRASHWSARINDDASQKSQSKIAFTVKWPAERVSRNHGFDL